MRTRCTHYTHQELPKTPEIQQQIANDARLAKMISNRIHSPIKKARRRKSNPRPKRTNIIPRRLVFGDEEKAGQVHDVASITPRGLAREHERKAQAQVGGDPESAAAEQSLEHSEAASSSREEQDEETPRCASRRLRLLFKIQVKAQGADRQTPVVPKDISDSVGEKKAGSSYSLLFMDKSVDRPTGRDRGSSQAVFLRGRRGERLRKIREGTVIAQ
jgi:hypothetical protein